MVLVYAYYMALRWLWVACLAATRQPRAGDNELRFQQPRRRKHNQLLGFHARTTYCNRPTCAIRPANARNRPALPVVGSPNPAPPPPTPPTTPPPPPPPPHLTHR